MEETPFDPAARRLCADGACVGLVGADGRCNVCGLADDGSAAAPQGAAREAPGDGSLWSVPMPESESAPASEPVSAAAARDDAGFDPARRLCDDGTCVGVIRADGVCSVCGRRPEAGS